MKVHYFQRYHKGEDVATANTMLLLSRLYVYSSEKFFRFLKGQYFSDTRFEPEIAFVLQEKGKASVADATITQPSFKLVIETKLTDWFEQDQLIRHLELFHDEEYKVLISISSVLMESKKREAIDKAIADYNLENQSHIIHVNTTFELLAQGVKDVISDLDYEMQNVLEDYLDYCHNDGLIVTSDAWKKMRMQLAGTTFDFNVTENVYYDNIDRGFSPHDYLGLYKQKSVRAVGKITAVVIATLKDGKMEYVTERGELTEEYKKKIEIAYEDGKKYGYDLTEQRYFFVEKFYETDFPKVTKGPSMGTRVFDLKELLQIEGDVMPEVSEIAERLRRKTWN